MYTEGKLQNVQSQFTKETQGIDKLRMRWKGSGNKIQQGSEQTYQKGTY